VSFGELVRELRLRQRKTLRQFCEEHGYDPSNWSKLERGVNPPPKRGQTLEKWAVQLDLGRNSDEWDDFMITAAVSRGEIPATIMANENVMGRLPAIFRVLARGRLSERQLDDMVEETERLGLSSDWRYW